MPTMLQCSNYKSLTSLSKLQVYHLLKPAVEEKHIKQFAHIHTHTSHQSCKITM